MIDAPGRKSPRFPEVKAEAVRKKIAERLRRWGIGPGDLAICGGACGADILFAEECLRRGAQIRLLLPQAIDDFVRDSVRHAGDDWVRRFHALREQAEVQILPEEPADSPNDLSIYARNNLWIVNTARVEAADNKKIRALLVWDQKPTGDGPGSDFVRRFAETAVETIIILPH